MNKYIIRVNKYKNWLASFTEGVLIRDAKLWQDEYIYETDLTFEEVTKISCVLSVKNLSIWIEHFKGYIMEHKDYPDLIYAV